MKPKYERIILKISGEALAGENKFGLDEEMLGQVARQVKEIHDIGVQVAIVVGGGNFWRGRTSKSMDRATADYMGMLATVMNAMALSDAMRQAGLNGRVQSALNIEQVVEPYIRGKAIRYLEEGKIVIFGAGTGNPYFTTDTAGSLRAIEIKADVIMKGTRVDGIYSADPEKDPDATKYGKITYQECITQKLNVMDMTAFTLCMENNLPIVVFDMNKPGNLRRVVTGEKVGTLVSA